MLKLFLISVLFYLCILQSQAQPNANWIVLEGKVSNKNLGTPLSATIILESLPYGADNRVFQSDANSGEFSFRVEDQKRYKVKVKAKGYIEILEEIVIHSDLQPLHFEMIPNGGGTLLSLNINFDQAKANILEDSYHELDKLVKMLNDYPGMEIQLEGHTDFRGSANANLRLSERRVQSVKKYLIEEGISSKRIKTKAFGGSEPISRENTEEAKLMNRRVQARILKTE
ncbi:OmpA family protein [Marivirga sp. S37H4]|uniref:OmpA family protein n=1 Tax=Marivirga aurantiaca TaxID=2802615 RepID=A0A934X1A3_9BACT|nr:OmpA family protein [Marivirga aurantiaca]MBK6266646.1 OmpA family protein [Marivirga aurantiaca]